MLKDIEKSIADDGVFPFNDNAEGAGAMPGRRQDIAVYAICAQIKPLGDCYVRDDWRVFAQPFTEGPADRGHDLGKPHGPFGELSIPLFQT